MTEPALKSEIQQEELPKLPGLGWLVLLAIGIAAMTMWLILYPFDFASEKQTTWLVETQIHKLNTLSNVLFFMPMGLINVWLLKLFWPRGGVGIAVVAALDAALFSLVGETLQMWLPDRQSSLVDLLANAVGGGVGALLGFSLAGWLTYQWSRAAYWLAKRSWARWALFVLVVVLLARTAPFDASPETSYLKESLFYQTKEAGGPFAKTRIWFKRDNLIGLPDTSEMSAELRRAGLNFGLFALAGFVLLRAAWQNRQLRGHPGSGIVGVFFFCTALVIFTEIAQWPIRSRLMDATDPIAGLAGVLLGLLLANVIGPPHAISTNARDA